MKPATPAAGAESSLATARLASVIADDVQLAHDLIEAIAEESADPQITQRLRAVLAVCRRAGLIADHLHRAHGGRGGQFPSAAHWTLAYQMNVEAFEALSVMAVEAG